MFKAIFSNTIFRKPPISSAINRGHPLSKSLVACFLMNEGRGKLLSNLANSSKNAKAGTNSPNYWSGINGGPSITFPADNDYFGSGTYNLSDKRNVLTMLAWIYLTSNSQPGMIFYNGSDDGAGANGGYGMFYGAASGGSGNNIMGLFGGVTWINPAGNSTITQMNVWHQVVMVRDSNLNTFFYVDGQFRYKDATNNQPNVIDNGFSIGDELTNASPKAVNGRRFIGSIGSCFLWERVLLPGEIYQLYREPYSFIVPK